jgi:hypothetical protein
MTFQSKTLMALALCLMLTGCGPGFSPMSYNAPTGLVAKIISQPSLNAVMGTNLASGVIFTFEDSRGNTTNVPKSYDIRAYTNSSCTAPATGTLTYSASGSSSLLLSSIKYSKAEDIYIGLAGGSVGTGACSRLVNVTSAMPALFTITSGQGQTAAAGLVLSSGVTFHVVDSANAPVKNAKVVVGMTSSSGTDASGNVTMNIPAGTLAGDIVLDVSLSYNSILVHDDGLNALVLASAPKSIQILSQSDPGTFQAGNPSDPIALTATDTYGNVVYPSFWSVVPAAGVYSNSNCTTLVGTVDAEDVSASPILDTGDDSTWWNQYLFTVNSPGTYYVRLQLADASGTPISPAASVCTAQNVLTP